MSGCGQRKSAPRPELGHRARCGRTSHRHSREEFLGASGIDALSSRGPSRAVRQRGGAGKGALPVRRHDWGARSAACDRIAPTAPVLFDQTRSAKRISCAGSARPASAEPRLRRSMTLRASQSRAVDKGCETLRRFHAPCRGTSGERPARLHHKRPRDRPLARRARD